MSKVFKILSIDGGGIKGLYSSTIIEHFEKRYGGSCSDYFDMICGTSTGGLIALGLSLKIPATRISEIYEKHGKEIFPKQSRLTGLFRQTVWRGKYRDEALKKVLKDIFGDKVIGESNNLLCIPTYSYTDARTWIFKFDHKEGGLDRHNRARYTDVALATSAAPTYLPLAEIDYFDYKQFIDGGVWANNPSLVGLIEAWRFFVGVGKEYDSVQILSISSLNNTAGQPTGLRRQRSFSDWKDDLFETSMIGQSSFTDYFLEQLHALTDIPVEYVRIPSEAISAEQQHLVKLDIATTESLRLLRGKGNDRGSIVTKDLQISNFFNTHKTYKTN